MALTRRAFFRTMFAASQAGLATRLLADTPAPPIDYTGALNFAILGDWGRRGRPDQSAVAQQMALACANAQASFVMAVGDNFYEDGVASLEDPHWKQSFEDVYTAPSLQVPWYVILGNHDYHGNSQAQLEYAKSHPRWIMPARHYTQIHTVDAATKMECFYIDTSPMISEYKFNPIMQSIHQQDVPAQLAWLDQKLGSSTAQWKIVIGHHPIYSAGHGHGTQFDLVKLLLPILEKHKVQAYFAGHDHDLEHLKVGSLDLIVSGAGSEYRPVKEPATSPFSRAVSGFVMASLSADNLQLQFIDNLGNNLYQTSVPR